MNLRKLEVGDIACSAESCEIVCDNNCPGSFTMNCIHMNTDEYVTEKCEYGLTCCYQDIVTEKLVEEAPSLFKSSEKE